jgi:flagellar basal body-associated protein FliL
MANNIDEEEPLDPVMERVRVKMIRLLVVSIGIMLLGLITVLGAVVYKINQSAEETDVQTENPDVPVTSTAPILENLEVELPNGARVVSSSLSNQNMLLDLRLANGERQFWVVDLQSGKIVSRITTK